jgi:cell division initiation protein
MVDQMAQLLTSLDVVNQSFKKSINGYDKTEVDEFLDQVADSLQQYAQKIKDLERDLLKKDEDLTEYDKMKNVLHETLLMAQKSADEKLKSTREEAEKILANAKEQAAKICGDATHEADRLRTGVSQIKNIRDMYADEVRGMLGKFDKLLSQCTISSQLAGAVNSVLDGMKKDPAQEEQKEAPKEQEHSSEAPKETPKE